MPTMYEEVVVKIVCKTDTTTCYYKWTTHTSVMVCWEVPVILTSANKFQGYLREKSLKHINTIITAKLTINDKYIIQGFDWTKFFAFLLKVQMATATKVTVSCAVRMRKTWSKRQNRNIRYSTEQLTTLKHSALVKSTFVNLLHLYTTFLAPSLWPGVL